MRWGARKSKKNTVLTPNVADAVHKFRYEMASELGENPRYYSGNWANMATRELERPDGQAIRHMIADAEADLRRKEGGFK